MTPDPVVLRPRRHARGRDPQDGRRRVPPHPGRRRGRPADRRRRPRRTSSGTSSPRSGDATRPSPAAPRIAVLADDLIWATRLADGVRARAASPWRCARRPRSTAALPAVDGCDRRPDGARLRRHRGLGAAAAAGVPGDRGGPARRRRRRDARRRRPGRRGSTPTARCSSTATASSAPGSASRRRPAARHDGGPMRSRPRPAIAGADPAERYAERLAARAARGGRGRASTRCSSASGADLRYLTGYEAMPLERLTMLVVPAADGAPLTLIAPRLEATPARTCPAAAAGAVEVATWEETEDPMALVARDARGGARPAGRRTCGAVAVSDGLRAAFVLGLQRVLPGARFSLASAVLRDAPDAQGRRRGRAAAGRGRTPRTGSSPRSPPGRSSGGPRPTSRARSASGCVAEGHDRAEFWIVASGPNSASPHHDPGERVIAAGRADRDRHRRHDRAATAATSRARSGSRAATRRTARTTTFRRLYGVLQDAPGGGDRRGPARACACERDRRRRARDHRRRGLRPELLPPDGPRHRPRGPRGAVPRRGQRASRWRRAWRSAWSPGSTSRAGTARGSRTSWSAARRARSSSTRRRGTCWSSPAEPDADGGRGAGGIIRRSVEPPRPTPRAHHDDLHARAPGPRCSGR